MFLDRTITSLLISAIFMCSTANLTSGSQATDSLTALLKTMPEDTSRVSVLADLSNQFLSSDGKEALAYARQATALSKKLKFMAGVAKAYSRMAEAYKQLAQYDSSFFYFRKSGAVFDSIGQPEGKVKALINIGNSHDQLGSFDSATHYLFLSLKLAESINSKALQNSALGATGLVFQHQSKHDEAIDYFQRALHISKELNNQLGTGISFENLGNTFSGKTDYITAKHYLDSALAVYKILGQKRALARINVNLASVLKYMGNYKEAMTSARFAAQSYQEMKNPNGSIHALLTIADINLMMNDFSNAVLVGHRALVITEETGIRPMKLESYRLLYQGYSGLGNYKQAYNYLEKASALNDSLFTEKKASIISEIQTKYETEKKENEIKLLNKDKQLSDTKIRKQEILRNSIITGTALLLIIGLLVFNRYRISQRHRQQADRMRISSDLHDEIGSTLSSISMYSAYAKEKPGEAGKALEEISASSQEMIGDMNDIIWAINPRNDSLEKTVARLHSYASGVTQSRNIIFDFRDDYSLNDAAISMEPRKNLFLICKEAINNAVKYSGCKTLTVELRKNKNQLWASISDDGNGFDTAQIFEGNGLKNMKLRADALNAALSIHSEKGKGTNVNLAMTI